MARNKKVACSSEVSDLRRRAFQNGNVGVCGSPKRFPSKYIYCGLLAVCNHRVFTHLLRFEAERGRLSRTILLKAEPLSCTIMPPRNSRTMQDLEDAFIKVSFEDDTGSESPSSPIFNGKKDPLYGPWFEHG